MRRQATDHPNPRTNRFLLCVGVLAGMLVGAPVCAALALEVVDGANSPVTAYRWLLEEDNTNPGVPGTAKVDTVSLVIHKSHAPVAATGDQAAVPIAVPDATKRYVLSVLADGYSVGGANITPGQTSVKVVLNKHPIPTAQINVLVFADHNPINNVPDATEAGLPGFRVIVSDIFGGPLMVDVFGNPLGTTYQFDPVSGDPVLDPEGAPVIAMMGNGNIYTDAYGRALIKNLAMGKYGVQAIPPTGQHWTGGHAGSPSINGAWHQTATIEGTITVDAWVKANEPMLFMEGFGPGFYHVFFGFVDPAQLPLSDPAAPARTTGTTVTGTLRYNHFGRPPVNQQFVAGPPVAEGWVGLNEINALGLPGPGLYAAPCDPNTGEFTIPNVEPGRYQLVTWDNPLDALFGFNTLTVPAPVAPAVTATYALGDILSYRWFGTYEGSVFYDNDADGFRDPSEIGLSQQAVNLRFRDGTVYMGTVTDDSGGFEMAEVFPFFKWLITEVDFTRFKATGLTVVVDEGGPIPPDSGWAMPSEGVRNPQPQYETNADGTINPAAPIINPNTGNNLSRTELSDDPAAPALTEAIHLFLNQNNRIDWGKTDYAPGENGGIGGIVSYNTTRAEDDPRLGTIEPWDAGVPRVQVVLYRDVDADKIIDDLDGDGGVTLADIDNYPLDWANPTPPAISERGPEDVDRNGDGVFDPGDALQIVWTDSFDDSPPTGSLQPNPPVILGTPIVGSDNYATWNQVRPAVFDGGYLLGSYYPGGMANALPTDEPVNYLPAGMYIVQACPPPGYLIQTEEGKNVDFGDAYAPSTLLLPPEVVGGPENHAGDTYLPNILPSLRDPASPFTVPAVLSLFPDQAVPCAYAGQQRPIADMKWVRVADGRNAACDFHTYTEVPKATRVVGFVLNDLTAEFNAPSPIFGEKGSPGWIPISFRDWAGHEVARSYSDEYGSYEALLPSTYNAAVPSPSGVAPNMLTMVLNDPTMPDPANPAVRIPDPYYNPAFATTPWTLHYLPGTFLYADTPIVPIAGFVNGPNKQLDVEPPDGTPVIRSVVVGPLDAPTVSGPYIPPGADPAAGGIVAIRSMGLTAVPNPEYNQNGTTPGVPSSINRDFGFGTHAPGGAGQVTIDGIAVPDAAIASWADDVISVNVGAVLAAGSSGQLMVTRDNGKTTPIGIILTRGSAADTYAVHTVVPVDPTVAPFATPIQDAIDAAAAGDLIIVPVSPWNYNENPILYKPVRLQGAGLDTIINATANPPERLTFWHAKVAALLGGDPFVANEAPGVMVLGQYLQGGTLQDAGFATHAARIDGLQIKGSVAGGGIGVFDKATGLRISNNRIIGNQGQFAGGISVGMQDMLGSTYRNEHIAIEYNQIFQNGGVNGAGGIGVYTGATGYTIRNNWIVGNFTRTSGGGIGHDGLSPAGLIAGNVIAFNEAFFGVAVGGDGGGISISGPAAAVIGGLGAGSGSVSIINNLIQGNLSGSGHGGGIRIAAVNGLDVVESAGIPEEWYALDIINNIIVDNAAGYSAGGISLQDAANVRIAHNTIANNDSTATAWSAFPSGATSSTPQGAGIVSHQHSALLTSVSGQLYADPELVNNIIWHNRSFYWDATTVPAALAPNPATPYVDLEIAEFPGLPLHPVNCLLSAAYPGGINNVAGDPLFASPYENVLYAAVVIDEAGNNISVRFEPTGLYTPAGDPQGDYHLTPASAAAIDAAAPVSAAAYDFDLQARPAGGAADIGADELSDAAATATVAATAPDVGPRPADTPPPVTSPVFGPGVPPGPPVAPLPLNPLPGDPRNPLVDPEPLIDTDGDGITDNDTAYMLLAASDGFATMGDGTELYTFGFSDLTHVVEVMTAMASMQPTPEAQEAVLRHLGPMIMMEGMLGGNIPAPTIVLKEGQHFHLDVANVGMMMRPDLFDPHTVHFHGFPNAAPIFDGEPMSSISVNMGATLRYYYRIVEPGTFLYHCHVEATEHMQMGMIGNLYVLPKQNNLPSQTFPNGYVHRQGVSKYAYNDGDGSTAYDVEAAIQVTGFDRNFHEQHIAVQPLPFAALADDYVMLNGRGYPDTVDPAELTSPSSNPSYPSQPVHSIVTATAGQKILLRLSNVSESDFHTLTVLGIPMRVVGKDARLLRGPTGRDLSYTTASVTLGGGETMDVILDTGPIDDRPGVAPGTYFLYSTRLNQLSNDQEDFGGAMTQITITAP